MDSVSRMIYRSSCCGLLLTLMEQKSGAEHLKELCKILALMPGDDASAIARTFPDLGGSGNSLGKWWSLQLASMAQPGMDELLGPTETEDQLAQALVLDLPGTTVKTEAKKSKGGALKRIFGKKKKQETSEEGSGTKKAEPAAITTPDSQASLDEIDRILSHPERAAILAQADLSLTKLSLRAHPLYRPLITEYRSLIASLSAGKKEKEAGELLAGLKRLRGKLQKDLQAADDYMNWYEATQTEGTSGAFRDYLKSAEELRRPPPPRRDPISRYMDLMEHEFQP